MDHCGECGFDYASTDVPTTYGPRPASGAVRGTSPGPLDCVAHRAVFSVGGGSSLNSAAAIQNAVITALGNIFRVPLIASFLLHRR